MLAALGFAMIITFMVLIMARLTSAAVALVLVPIVFGLFAGHGTDMARMSIDGVQDLAPTVVALVFAVLYFGVMIDTGLFDPIVRRAVRFAKGDPLRVTLSTTTVATLVSLDGDGATTALVTITAFLPIYQRLKMNPLIIAVLLGLSNSIINLAPWGAPTARAAAALDVELMDVFLPLIPTMIAGIAATFGVAWILGTRERKRLGIVELETELTESFFEREEGIERPKLFWFNAVLTLLLIGSVVLQILPLPIAFMIGLPIALTVNYPGVKQQTARLMSHSDNVLPIVLLIFSAGVFTGILDGTEMAKAMGDTMTGFVPESMGRFFGPIIALASGPLTFVLSNDAYYFAVVPVVAEAAGNFGLSPVEAARASLLGQCVHALSPLIASIYLVAALLKCEVGDLQRIAFPIAVGMYLFMVVVAVLTGAVPLAVS